MRVAPVRALVAPPQSMSESHSSCTGTGCEADAAAAGALTSFETMEERMLEASECEMSVTKPGAFGTSDVDGDVTAS